ncbi:Piwi-domain-containing protein, partial [Mollisia scopiformis]
LKTNYRLGGIVHSLRDPLPVRGTTMIVGADVTHPGKVNDTTCPSMAGVVATYDTYYMTYLASARLQKKNTEHISDLKGMMKERLHAYKSKNGGSLPEHILFYRDGVSESQFGEVRATELPQIIEACKEEAGAVPRPRITLVIVIKRHHSRFFPNPENRQNNKSGLLVDETVVAPKQFNFYLQAHDSPIGTARNTHYVVLENESGYNADELQSITNKLSFTASKGTKGLSVCTPARYADTLCDRLRRYMRPALELDRSVNYPNYPDHTLINYNHDVVIWNAPRAAIKVNGRTTVEARTNPWRPELNDFMFYL